MTRNERQRQYRAELRYCAPPRPCLRCGKDFRPLRDNIRRGWGKYCSQACTVAAQWDAKGRGVTPLSQRWILPGESIPAGRPKRYLNDLGYAILWWKIGPRSYLLLSEHRFVAGNPANHVHHKNRIKDDNRPENLEILPEQEHRLRHCKLDRNAAAKMFQEGVGTQQIAWVYGVQAAHVRRTLVAMGVCARRIRRPA
jgi:hypothetical protein